MQRKTILAATGFVAALCLVVMVSSAATGTAVATTAPNNTTPNYYNETVTVNNESWMEGRENATLDNTVNMLTRVGTFVIAGSGSGAIGAVLTGLMVFGAVLSMLGDTAVGVGGGAVLGVATIAALSLAGFVSSWVWALTVFAVGVVCAAVLIRALR